VCPFLHGTRGLPTLSKPDLNASPKRGQEVTSTAKRKGQPTRKQKGGVGIGIPPTFQTDPDLLRKGPNDRTSLRDVQRRKGPILLLQNEGVSVPGKRRDLTERGRRFGGKREGNGSKGGLI